ncbi:hypothetical protein CFP56_001654 [Quercus suber]|uniref:Uncharacterized protein n=1 Tax=Quercus suber TaxID=58331 RepID=A0AAW0LGT1_QUESU
MPSLRREKLFVLTLSTLMRKGYQAYGLGARRELPPAVPVATVTSATTLGSYANDLYYAYRYGALSGDPYLPSVRREEVPSGSYSVGGTFPGATAHLLSTYVADALLRYNQTQNRQVAQLEAVSVPVSSRYSFAVVTKCLANVANGRQTHIAYGGTGLQAKK